MEIRIEGKEPVGKTEDSIDKKAQANIDVKDIERIVFEAYSNQDKLPRKEYVEEESYVNPSHADLSVEVDYEDQRLMSMVNRGVQRREPIEYKAVNDDTLGRDTIKLNYNEICLG